MSQLPPFSVRALYPYWTDVEGDLPFDEAQVITVEVIEDDDWYTGTYTDPATGYPKTGIFPQNYVELIAQDPEPPLQHQQQQPQQHQESNNYDNYEQDGGYSSEDEQPVQSPELAPIIPVTPVSAPASVPVPVPAPVPAPVSVLQSASIPPIPSTPSIPSIPVQSSSPPQATYSEPSSYSSPPKKRNAFQDRIAAFNSSNAAPSPFALPKQPTYSRKPFQAVPTNSYVPQLSQFSKHVKAVQTIPAADIVHYNDPESEEEQAMPTVSLKERIKLLQQQQQAEAARAEALAMKKKRKPKPNLDEDQTENHENSVPTSGAALKAGNSEGSLITPNYGAEDNTERPAGGLEGHSASLPQHQPVQQEAEEEDESSEEEEDEEEARRIALHKRLAKFSGGMGMLGMGMPGMAMPGGFGAPLDLPKKKKKKAKEEPVEAIQAPIPIFPFANPGSMPEALQRAPKMEDYNAGRSEGHPTGTDIHNEDLHSVPESVTSHDILAPSINALSETSPEIVPASNILEPIVPKGSHHAYSAFLDADEPLHETAVKNVPLGAPHEPKFVPEVEREPVPVDLKNVPAQTPWLENTSKPVSDFNVDNEPQFNASSPNTFSTLPEAKNGIESVINAHKDDYDESGSENAWSSSDSDDADSQFQGDFKVTSSVEKPFLPSTADETNDEPRERTGTFPLQY